MSRSTRSVIFDMDGVLCDSEPFINEAAIGVLRDRYGLVTAPEEFLPFTGTGDARYISGVAAEHGLELDPERAKAELYQRYLAIIRGRLRPTPGAHAFLAACRAAGLRMALATSADAVKVDANLAEIAIDRNVFAVIVSGQDVTRRKPAPDIFLLTAERLRVPPGSCLVIEDALTGVRAAKAAGMRCLALATSFPPDQLERAGADFVAADFADLPAGLWDEVVAGPASTRVAR
jgi:HAD superfamily hydrolase (TIGR01509 family)